MLHSLPGQQMLGDQQIFFLLFTIPACSPIKSKYFLAPGPGEPQGALIFAFALISANSSDTSNQVKRINCVMKCFY